MAYSRVERSTWDDERFRAWPREVRDTWLYLLTCRHQGRLGMFVLDPMFIAADVQIPIEAARSALELLASEERILWDPATRLVMIVRHLKHNPIENPNVATAALRELFAQPFAEPLWRGLKRAVETWGAMTTARGEPFCSPIVEAIDKRLRERDLNRSANGSGNGMPNGTSWGGFGNPDPFPDPLPEPDNPPVVPPCERGDTTEEGFSPQDEVARSALPGDSARSRSARGAPSGRKRSALSDDWAPNEGHRELASSLGVDPAFEAEQFRDHHAARGSTFVSWDSEFSKWLRNAPGFKRRDVESSRPPPGSEARRVLDTGQERPRSGTTRRSDMEEQIEREEARRIAEWAKQHPDEAGRIRIEIEGEVQRDFAGGPVGSGTLEKLVAARYRTKALERMAAASAAA